MHGSRGQHFLLGGTWGVCGRADLGLSVCMQFLAHNCDPPPQHTETSGEELFRFFRVMNVMRRMEIASDLLYKQGHIRGFCHLYDGQEAVAVGMEAALTWEDPLITAYRGERRATGRTGSAGRAQLRRLCGFPCPTCAGPCDGGNVLTWSLAVGCRALQLPGARGHRDAGEPLRQHSG